MRRDPSFREEPVLLLLLVVFVFVVGSKIAGWTADHLAEMKAKAEQSERASALAAEYATIEAMSPEDVFEYFNIDPVSARIPPHSPFFWTSDREIKVPISLMEWDEEIRCDTYLTKGVYMGYLERFVSSSRKMKVGRTGGTKYQSKVFGYPVLAPEEDAACRMTSTITATVEASDGKEFLFTQVFVTEFVYVGDYPELDPDVEIFPKPLTR